MKKKKKKKPFLRNIIIVLLARLKKQDTTILEIRGHFQAAPKNIQRKTKNRKTPRRAIGN